MGAARLAAGRREGGGSARARLGLGRGRTAGHSRRGAAGSSGQRGPVDTLSGSDCSWLATWSHWGGVVRGIP